jgi:hypothetical protein
MYITFDNYYSEEKYNEFIQASKNNNIQVQEYISIRPPYFWYLKVDQTPQFLNFETLPKKDEKWLVSKLQARYPNEEYILQRRIGSNIAFEKYISNSVLVKTRTEPYFIIFKAGGKAEVQELSTKIPDVKIWDLGKIRGYHYLVSFNKYHKNFLLSTQIVIEKTKPNEFKNPGEVEQFLNYNIFVKYKLENKTIEVPYFENGNFVPLKKQL